MSQRVEFAALPGVAPLALPAALRDLFGFVLREAPSSRSLREHLRGQGRFDKDGFPMLADFLGLGSTEPVDPGDFGRSLLAAEDEADVRAAMARRLIDANPLLAKYCLEALDVDRGGRLHSTNELFRMVTSYVYPGARPTLPAFKAWIDWSAAAGLIRVVGIRWAIGPAGATALPGLRAIDPEEFLEDERAATAVSEAPEPPAPAASATVPPNDPQTGPVPPGLAPASNAPAEVAPAATAADAVVSAPPPEAVPPSRGPVPPPASRKDLAAALQDRYLAAGLADPFSPEAIGVDAAKDDARVRLERAFGALLLARGVGAGVAGRALAALRGEGALEVASKGRIPAEAVARVLADAPEPGFVAACEALVHLPRLAAGLREGVWPDAPRDLLDAAWQRLYAPYAPLAPFVFARLLWSAGRLDARAAPAAFVPVFAARESAFRLGLADRMHAGSFAALADLSLGLAAAFGPPAFEAPLAWMVPIFGCAFGCPRTRTCPLPCREKAEVAAPAAGGLS